MTRLHYLQHVPFEGPANIEAWAQARGHAMTGTQLFAGDELPQSGDFDCLVVMGGPMGANDEDAYPWMTLEKKLIEGTLAAGKPVIGVCLGAQLIASALGARVYRNDEKEIGWFPVQRADDVTASPFADVPASFVPLHWHGDTFDLPSGARLLASSVGCRNQAFEYESALGLQFHIEATEESVALLLEHCADEIGNGRFEQDPQHLADCEAQVAAVEPILFGVLDRIAG